MKRRFDSSLLNFLKELKAFHSSSGNSVVSFPSISGRDVNLHKLYKIVSANGGFDKVSLEDKWTLILEELNIPEECANASEVVKQIYQRYLEKYERTRKKDGNGGLPDFDADDVPETEDAHDTRFTAVYKSRRSEVYNDFRSVNFGQEQPQRAVAAVPTSPMPPSYSRLYKSLLCGLPNEFDLGVSACLAVSLRDNRIPLHPIHFSLFIDLLCAHAGIFGDDQAQLSSLYTDWRKSDHLQFFTFWSRSVKCQLHEDFTDVKDLLYSPSVAKFIDEEVYRHNAADTSTDESELSCIPISKEGFVVEMIASVFRNLSFDSCNAVLMANSAPLLRFLFLGSHCNYRNVSASCLDTIGRLAPTLTLSSLDLLVNSGATLLTDFVRNTIIHSDDRARVLVAAEILASLCQNDSNFEDICSFIDSSLCNKLFQYLLVPDIHLVVNCAEAIYQISELGPSPCDVIAANEHNLTMVFALTTIEAVAFGPDAIVNIKVVAQHGAGVPAAQPSFPMNPRFHPRQLQSVPTNVRPAVQQFVPKPTPPQLIFVYASNWLRTVLEPSTPSTQRHSESLLELYNEYLAAASYANNKSVFDNVHMFADCICRVFPFAAIKSPPPGRIETARIFGVRKMIAGSHPGITVPQPSMPVVPVMMNNEPQPFVLGSGEIVTSNGPSKLLSRQLPEACVANGTPGVAGNDSHDGVLRVVGAPVTAADMIDREHRQRELAIVRVENKPLPQHHVNGHSCEMETKQNGEHDSNGKAETLDQLLGSNDDVKDENNGIVVPNGGSTKKPIDSVEKPKIQEEETNGKSPHSNGVIDEEPVHHVNGFIHSAPNDEVVNCYHNARRLQPQDSVDTNTTTNNNGHNDETSMLSSADSNSAAVFASDVSESAASLGGGDTSRMSTVSEVDSCREKRPPMKYCSSVGNNDSRSTAPVNTYNENLIPQLPVPSAAPFNYVNTVPGSNMPPPVQQQQSSLPFPCRWNNCTESFASADCLHKHFVGGHIPQLPSAYGARSPCLWNGCIWPVPRLKWSLLAHVKDFHLNSNVSVVNQQRITHPDAEIPTDAGLRAVLTNFCQTTPFHPPPPGFEGPVTKQMRLAGGLILRNLAKHSVNGKRFVHRHIHELVAIAFSGIESSSAVLAALDEATREAPVENAEQ